MTDLGITLVTGATGFIGCPLCRRLRAEGIRVRGLTRREPAAECSGTEMVTATDLSDREAVKKALCGVETVIHLAARVHIMEDRAANPLAEFRRVNVEGTRLLLEEAASNGTKRFLFVSSVKAMGDQSDEVWTEATTPVPKDPYGQSKLEAEQLVQRMAFAAGMRAAILRLPLVYGPGMKGNMLRLFQLVDRGIPLPLARVRNRRSLVYVGNVVEAILTTLRVPVGSGEVFLVSDGHDPSTPELLRTIGKALGRPARLIPMPLLALRAAGRIGDALSRLGRFPLTTAAVDRLLGSLVVDSGRIRDVIGFHAPFSTTDGMRHTAVWYRDRRGSSNDVVQHLAG